ncbi:sulfotransferase [Bailinhaonella thermotolerans]|uniref:Sulfotransferase n=1 Tax=Bailinhaonella thermotolerans TaxID=1070861 RepID=A0A3A4B702_9ACTN|nr:sulfotransferase [Bailinhaonella thermotolerans]RJL33284.1 sulfotransferase [Bailinhaonella thermotolerans]
MFVGGLGRSGTTLLERLLGELPGVVALGEVTHLWERGLLAGEPCGCRTAFRDCPFWSEVGKRAFGGWDRFDLRRHLALKRRVERTRRIPALAAGPGTGDVAAYAVPYLRLYHAAREVSGCPVVVDSSKHAALAYCLRRAPGLRVLHMVRDPRGVAHSWAKRVARPEGDYMTRWTAARSALNWTTQNLAFEALARTRVPRTLIRYEDLLAAPRDTLAGLAALLGVPADLGFCGDDHAFLTTAHTASGNPMRFVTGRVGLAPDDEWRLWLPARERKVVTALTLPLLIRYGYRPEHA